MGYHNFGKNNEYNLQHQQGYFSWQIIFPYVSLSVPSCPYVFLWFSHCFQGKCPVVSYSFPIVSPLVSMTMIFTHWINNGKYGFPMVFLWFSYIFSHGQGIFPWSFFKLSKRPVTIEEMAQGFGGPNSSQFHLRKRCMNNSQQQWEKQQENHMFTILSYGFLIWVNILLDGNQW